MEISNRINRQQIIKLTLSTLGHTWLLDLDGVILRHNGYKHGGDEFLPGAKDFLLGLPPNDTLIFLTSRTDEDIKTTVSFLAGHGIKALIIPNLPHGERVLINDRKPSGLPTAHAVNLERDAPFALSYTLDQQR